MDIARVSPANPSIINVAILEVGLVLVLIDIREVVTNLINIAAAAALAVLAKDLQMAKRASWTSPCSRDFAWVHLPLLANHV